MYGLKIIDQTYWRDSWSAEIGQRLNILNSTHNLFVFDEQTGRDDIIKVLKDVPREAYNLIKMHPSTQGCCEILADDGQCYELDGQT